MHKTVILFKWLIPVLISISSTFSIAQHTGNIRGVVTDSLNGEALPFCNVLISELNTGASTNERGIFYLNSIPANQNYELLISYVGYRSEKITVEVLPGKLSDLQIQLTPLSIQLREVEKIGEKVIQKNSTDIGLEKISVKRLEVLPKSVETDVLRSLQTLPGVTSTGDVTAKYYVRGGSGDQNLVQLNGITIYNPFHSLGLFSVIDPEMINSMEFYKGGFTSEYGGRVSSVLNVVSKDGNKNRFGFKGSVSSLSMKGLVEGPIPNGSFLIAGRKSHSTEVLKNFLNDETVPSDFYDLSFKLNYSSKNIFNNAKFVLTGFLSSDKIQYDDPLREEYDWKNNLLGFEWLQIYDVPMFSRLGISVSSFTGNVIPNGSSLKPRKNELTDITTSFDLNIINDSKDELAFGLNIKLVDAKLFQENQYGVPSDLNKYAGNLSIYGKYKFLRFEDFGADIGTRMIVTGLNTNTSGSLEPRVSLTYRLMPVLALKGSWGIYYQELTALSDENELVSIFEPWLIIPDNINPTRAINYSGGIEYNISADLLFQAEGYYRVMNNLPIINEEKYSSDDPDLISGKGESYGWEFLLRQTSSTLSFSASYTLSWAYKEVDNYLYYPKYDTRNAVNLSIDYNLGSGWIASTAWSYYSGLPFTEINGAYEKYYYNNLFNPFFNTGYYSPYQLLGDRNLSRLPEYHRLDLGVTKRMQFSFLKLELGLNVINVYDRNNIFYYERDTGRRVNMLPRLISGTIKIEL